MPEPCTGELNTPIKIEQNTKTKDSHGGRVDGWDLYAQKWAKVRHKRGGEKSLTDYGGRESNARIELTVRHFSGLTNENRASFRVVMDGVAHEISHVNPWNNERQWLLITCEVR